MYRISSQACEFYDLTDQEMKDSGILKQLDDWLIQNNKHACIDHRIAEEINYDLVKQFNKETGI